MLEVFEFVFWGFAMETWSMNAFEIPTTELC